MIKIEIQDLDVKKQEYLDAILLKVVKRVAILQKSLTHLNGGTIDFSDNDLTNVKAVTNHIIASLGDKYTVENGRKGYIDSIRRYLPTQNRLGNINITGLSNLLLHLLQNSNEELADLLVCNPDDLMNRNVALLNRFQTTTVADIAILKLAFDYKKYENDISANIKLYFRGRNFTKICPYCNFEEVDHESNTSGEVVTSYELDHFYDKARYPLLSYSLFNLVPSDHTCNALNKRTTQFSDEFHINAYVMGYSDKICFRPKSIDTAYKVDAVDVVILEPAGSAMYKRINGNNPSDLERGEFGNLNVFKIRSKYQRKRRFAGNLLRTLNDKNKNLKHQQTYYQGMSAAEKQMSYIEWFQETFEVGFYPANFSEQKFSKFARDIHDYYFLNNKSDWNEFIVELIDIYPG